MLCDIPEQSGDISDVGDDGGDSNDGVMEQKMST